MVGKGICPFYGLQSVKIGSNSHCLLDNCKTLVISQVELIPVR